MSRCVPVWAVACLLVLGMASQASTEPPGLSGLSLRAGLLVGDVDAPTDDSRTLAGGGTGAPGEKSVVRAMLLSALLPGLGEIYAGGTRGYATGGAMAAVEVFSIWGYVSNNRSGNDEKSRYRTFGNLHYSRDSLYDYVEGVIAPWSGSSELSSCRHSTIPPDTYDRDKCLEQLHTSFPLSANGSDDFYQQIGADDRYLMGWDDWQPDSIANHEVKWTGWNPGDPIPDGLPSTTEHRQQYRQMRERADDFYAKSDRFAWVMVIGRVVSMIDTAILVKIRNRDLAGLGTNPRLSLKVDVAAQPRFRVGLKTRF
jgi:hypothetical protein